MKNKAIHIIGLTGLAQAGKTSIAKMALARRTGPGRLIPFSEPLKRTAMSMGWNGVKDERGRKLLQLLGTEVGRNLIDPDIWVMKWRESVAEWRNEIEEYTTSYPPKSFSSILIADDVRFENEADAIRQLGGMIFEVVGGHSTSGDNHASEAGISKASIDCVLINDIDWNEEPEALRFLSDTIIRTVEEAER